MESLMRREPARVIATVTAVLALIAGSGVSWITDQRSALIVAAVAAVLGLFGGEAVRSQVYAPATVANHDAGPDGDGHLDEGVDEPGEHAVDRVPDLDDHSDLFASPDPGGSTAAPGA